jgi:UDP:flavonoid glycosyltransferase YjiC (YdhE family)
VRILFSGLPSAGHVIPMLPLARAARRHHTTALLCHPEVAGIVEPLEVLPTGPTLAELFGEVARRTGGASPKAPGPATIELFVGARVSLTLDSALARARAFGPDLIVAEELDYIGPMVAAELGIPWVAHSISGGIPAPLRAPLAEAAAVEYARRHLTEVERIGIVDPYPDVIRGFPGAEDRIPVRPEAYDRPGDKWMPATPAAGGRPRVLLSAGTTVDEPASMTAMASAIVSEGVDVIMTGTGGAGLPDVVEVVPFVPIAQLLPHVDAVVTAGGTGTVLATLAAGLPLVIKPFIADQPWNAERATELGAAVTIHEDSLAGKAVTEVLSPPRRARARYAAEQIALLGSPEDALAEILQRLGRNA